MANQKYCIVCHKTLDESEFYQTNDLEKYPDGKIDKCKQCFTLMVDNWVPSTFLPLLEELDVPYIKKQWDKLLEKYSNQTKPEDMTGLTILGRYLSTMKMKQYSHLRWKDTAEIQAKEDEKKATAMRKQGFSEEDIKKQIEEDHAMTVPLPDNYKVLDSGEEVEVEVEEEDDFESTLDLTDEDRTYLRLKWGKDYTPEEWVTLEQFYMDMCNAFDVQTPSHKDTLKLMCKTSLKANQLLDGGDIDGFQKMSKTYDMLSKSGNFSAIQNKATRGDVVDAACELVVICEKEGFIPRFYIDKPQDKVDRVLQDYQNYARVLIEEELGWSDKIESAAKQLMEARENEYKIDDTDDDDFSDMTESFENSLFEKSRPIFLNDEDLMEFNEFMEEAELADEELIKELL